MSCSGMTRPLDDLGRVVIPIEIRRRFGLVKDDLLTIVTDENGITLIPLRTACTFCGGEQHLTEYMGKQVCAACIAKFN